MGDHHRRCSRAREQRQHLPTARKPWFSVQKRCARALRGDFLAPTHRYGIRVASGAQRSHESGPTLMGMFCASTAGARETFGRLGSFRERSRHSAPRMCRVRRTDPAVHLAKKLECEGVQRAIHFFISSLL